MEPSFIVIAVDPQGKLFIVGGGDQEEDCTPYAQNHLALHPDHKVHVYEHMAEVVKS